jgi:hypothetical protein
MTPLEAQRVGQAAVFREWALLIDAGLATREILRYWHTRLADYSHEFAEGPDLSRMRLLVDDRLGVDQSDLLPDHPPEDEGWQVPDSPPEDPGEQPPPEHPRREW